MNALFWSWACISADYRGKTTSFEPACLRIPHVSCLLLPSVFVCPATPWIRCGSTDFILTRTRYRKIFISIYALKRIERIEPTTTIGDSSYLSKGWNSIRFSLLSTRCLHLVINHVLLPSPALCLPLSRIVMETMCDRRGFSCPFSDSPRFPCSLGLSDRRESTRNGETKSC